MSTIDPHLAPEYGRCALITVDIQNDTLDGAPFEIPGTSAMLPRVRRLCQAFRQAGRPIVHVIRIYTHDARDADRCRRAALLAGKPLLLKGSPGRRPADALLPDPAVPIDDDLLLSGGIQTIGPAEGILFKPRWGSFYRTPLEPFLDGKKISTLVIAGSNFPNCPRATIIEASERDFRIAAVTDAISGLTPADLAWLEKIGVQCVNTDVVCGHLPTTISLPM